MSDEQLYYKVGRRYYPAHTTMRHSFPCEGVWLVTYGPGHDRARLLTERLGDVPEPLHLAAVERYRLQPRRWRSQRAVFCLPRHRRDPVRLPGGRGPHLRQAAVPSVRRLGGARRRLLPDAPARAGARSCLTPSSPSS